MHSSRNDGLCTHLSVTRCQLNPASSLDSSLASKIRRYFHKGAWRLFANAFGSVRHIAFMEMFQKAPIIQVEIVLGVRLIGWLRPGNRVESGLSVGEIEFPRVEKRLVAAIFSHGPLQCLITFEPFVRDASHQRSKCRDFFVNLRRMLILPTCAQPVSDVLNNDPVGTAFSQRLKSLVETLDAPLCAGEGTLFFQARTGWQYHIRKAAGLTEEDLLHYEEIELRQRIRNIVRVGIH